MGPVVVQFSTVNLLTILYFERIVRVMCRQFLEIASVAMSGYPRAKFQENMQHLSNICHVFHYAGPSEIEMLLLQDT